MVPTLIMTGKAVSHAGTSAGGLRVKRAMTLNFEYKYGPGAKWPSTKRPVIASTARNMSSDSFGDIQAASKSAG